MNYRAIICIIVISLFERLPVSYYVFENLLFRLAYATNTFGKIIRKLKSSYKTRITKAPTFENRQCRVYWLCSHIVQNNLHCLELPFTVFYFQDFSKCKREN